MNSKRERNSSDTPVKQTNMTPVLPVKNSMFSQCRRLGLSKRKLSTSPIGNTPNKFSPVQSTSKIETPNVNTTLTPASPRLSTSRVKQQTNLPVKRKLDDKKYDPPEGNTSLNNSIVNNSPVYKKRNLKFVDIFNTESNQDLPKTTNDSTVNKQYKCEINSKDKIMLKCTNSNVTSVQKNKTVNETTKHTNKQKNNKSIPDDLDKTGNKLKNAFEKIKYDRKRKKDQLNHKNNKTSPSHKKSTDCVPYSPPENSKYVVNGNISNQNVDNNKYDNLRITITRLEITQSPVNLKTTNLEDDIFNGKKKYTKNSDNSVSEDEVTVKKSKSHRKSRKSEHSNERKKDSKKHHKKLHNKHKKGKHNENETQSSSSSEELLNTSVESIETQTENESIPNEININDSAENIEPTVTDESIQKHDIKLNNETEQIFNSSLNVSGTEKNILPTDKRVEYISPSPETIPIKKRKLRENETVDNSPNTDKNEVIKDSISDTPPTSKDSILDIPSTSKDSISDILPTSKDNISDTSPTSKDSILDIPSTSKDSISDIPPISKDSISDIPPISKDCISDTPSTSKDSILYIPSTAKDSILNIPSTSKDSILYIPSTSKDSILDIPSTSKFSLSDIPSTSKDTILYIPSTSKDSILDIPSTSKFSLSDIPSTSKDSILYISSASKDTMSDIPSTSKESILSVTNEEKINNSNNNEIMENIQNDNLEKTDDTKKVELKVNNITTETSLEKSEENGIDDINLNNIVNNDVNNKCDIDKYNSNQPDNIINVNIEEKPTGTMVNGKEINETKRRRRRSRTKKDLTFNGNPLLDSLKDNDSLYNNYTLKKTRTKQVMDYSEYLSSEDSVESVKPVRKRGRPKKHVPLYLNLKTETQNKIETDETNLSNDTKSKPTRRRSSASNSKDDIDLDNNEDNMPLSERIDRDKKNKKELINSETFKISEKNIATRKRKTSEVYYKEDSASSIEDFLVKDLIINKNTNIDKPTTFNNLLDRIEERVSPNSIYTFREESEEKLTLEELRMKRKQDNINKNNSLDDIRPYNPLEDSSNATNCVNIENHIETDKKDKYTNRIAVKRSAVGQKRNISHRWNSRFNNETSETYSPRRRINQRSKSTSYTLSTVAAIHEPRLRNNDPIIPIPGTSRSSDLNIVNNEIVNHSNIVVPAQVFTTGPNLSNNITQEQMINEIVICNSIEISNNEVTSTSDLLRSIQHVEKTNTTENETDMKDIQEIAAILVTNEGPTLLEKVQKDVGSTPEPTIELVPNVSEIPTENVYHIPPTNNISVPKLNKLHKIMDDYKETIDNFERGNADLIPVPLNESVENIIINSLDIPVLGNQENIPQNLEKNEENKSVVTLDANSSVFYTPSVSDEERTSEEIIDKNISNENVNEKISENNLSTIIKDIVQSNNNLIMVSDDLNERNMEKEKIVSGNISENIIIQSPSGSLSTIELELEHELEVANELEVVNEIECEILNENEIETITTKEKSEEKEMNKNECEIEICNKPEIVVEQKIEKENNNELKESEIFIENQYKFEISKENKNEEKIIYKNKNEGEITEKSIIVEEITDKNINEDKITENINDDKNTNEDKITNKSIDEDKILNKNINEDKTENKNINEGKTQNKCINESENEITNKNENTNVDKIISEVVNQNNKCQITTEDKNEPEIIKENKSTNNKNNVGDNSRITKIMNDLQKRTEPDKDDNEEDSINHTESLLDVDKISINDIWNVIGCSSYKRSEPKEIEVIPSTSKENKIEENSFSKVNTESVKEDIVKELTNENIKETVNKDMGREILIKNNRKPIVLLRRVDEIMNIKEIIQMKEITNKESTKDILNKNSVEEITNKEPGEGITNKDLVKESVLKNTRKEVTIEDVMNEIASQVHKERCEKEEILNEQRKKETRNKSITNQNENSTEIENVSRQPTEKKITRQYKGKNRVRFAETSPVTDLSQPSTSRSYNENIFDSEDSLDTENRQDISQPSNSNNEPNESSPAPQSITVYSINDKHTKRKTQKIVPYKLNEKHTMVTLHINNTVQYIKVNNAIDSIKNKNNQEVSQPLEGNKNDSKEIEKVINNCDLDTESNSDDKPKQIMKNEDKLGDDKDSITSRIIKTLTNENNNHTPGVDTRIVYKHRHEKGRVTIQQEVEQTKSLIKNRTASLTKRDTTSIFDPLIYDVDSYMYNQTRPVLPFTLEGRKAYYKECITEIEKAKKAEKTKLDVLKQLHVVIQFQEKGNERKQLLLKYKEVAQQALMELAAELRANCDVPFTMATLLHNLQIPHHIVGYNENLDFFTS